MVAAVGAEAEEVGVEETSAAKREREMDVEPSDPKRVRTDPLAAADEAAAAEPVAPVSDAALITAPELAPPPTAPDMVPPPSLPALVPPSGMPAMVPPLPPPTGDGWGAPPAVPAHGPAGGKVCKDFQNGVCHRGAGCVRPCGHLPASVREGSAGEVRDRSEGRERGRRGPRGLCSGRRLHREVPMHDQPHTRWQAPPPRRV